MLDNEHLVFDAEQLEKRAKYRIAYKTLENKKVGKFGTAMDKAFSAIIN